MRAQPSLRSQARSAWQPGRRLLAGPKRGGAILHLRLSWRAVKRVHDLRMAGRVLFLSALILGAAQFCTGQLAAQAVPDSATKVAASARWLVGPFVGLAHNSPAGSYLGATPGRDHLFLGVEAVTTILRFGLFRLAYTAQLLPLVVIRGTSLPDGYYPPPGAPATPSTAYAIGVSPFGLELGVLAAKRLDIYLAAAAGGLWFTRPFPVPEAAQINFTLEYGAGARLRTTSRQWLQLGYKYHHLSNAYTKILNPGLDGHVFYVGYQWEVQLPR